MLLVEEEQAKFVPSEKQGLSPGQLIRVKEGSYFIYDPELTLPRKQNIRPYVYIEASVGLFIQVNLPASQIASRVNPFHVVLVHNLLLEIDTQCAQKLE